MSEKVFSKGELRTFDSIRCEELRVICGTRGVPGTVAPFRAWRGSRDLVAQSPKFHAPAVASQRLQTKILTQRHERQQRRTPLRASGIENFCKILWTLFKFRV